MLLSALLAMPFAAALSSAADSTATPPPAPRPCSAPEARQLDFWIGDWDLDSHAASGNGQWLDEKGKATNHVRAILGGCVIEESFDGAHLASPLVGRSLSMFVPALGKWRQTWMDDQGSYLALTGGREGDRFVLSTEPRLVNGTSRISRMVFHDIQPEGFVWDWEGSTDAGRTWTLNWRLTYRRHH
jgi:Protein of unknown function (DUF1579)